MNMMQMTYFEIKSHADVLSLGMMISFLLSAMLFVKLAIRSANEVVANISPGVDEQNRAFSFFCLSITII